MPRVIRPDLILTEKGYIIAEIDSVPGGIGLTGWLNQTYSSFDNDIIGGANGMLDGFRAVVPNGARHRHLAGIGYLPAGDGVASDAVESKSNVEDRTPSHRTRGGLWPRKIMSRKMDALCIGSSNYSICQIFPKSKTRCGPTQKDESRLRRRSSRISRRKCGSRLFWLQPLREYWRRELGEKYFMKLQEVIPYSWLLDPTPLPQHAVIPRLEIHDWREAAKFSQKDRELLLKVSGFSPLGWGSRGIALGSDLPHADWEKRIEHSLATFESNPTILQKFHKGRSL